MLVSPDPTHICDVYHAVHTSCDSRTAIVFVSEGSERVKTATLSFKLNQVLSIRDCYECKLRQKERGISKRMTTTQKKINLDSVTAQALFKAVTQVTNEINGTMIKDYRKRNNPLKPIAQAS